MFHIKRTREGIVFVHGRKREEKEVKLYRYMVMFCYIRKLYICNGKLKIGYRKGSIIVVNWAYNDFFNGRDKWN